MATLTVTFTAPSPAPSNGYIVKYRKKDTNDPYVSFPAIGSPVVINNVDEYQSYEGTVTSMCEPTTGTITTSPLVPFVAIATPRPSVTGTISTTCIFPSTSSQGYLRFVFSFSGPTIQPITIDMGYCWGPTQTGFRFCEGVQIIGQMPVGYASDESFCPQGYTINIPAGVSTYSTAHLWCNRPGPGQTDAVCGRSPNFAPPSHIFMRVTNIPNMILNLTPQQSFTFIQL